MDHCMHAFNRQLDPISMCLPSLSYFTLFVDAIQSKMDRNHGSQFLGGMQGPLGRC